MSSGLTPELALLLVEQGMKQSEIAADFGVTRQYVNKLAKQAGYVSSMTIVNENLPWEVSPDYQTNTLYQAVRLVGHCNLGDISSKSSERKLSALLKKLRAFNQVIDFDPGYPAIPGVVNTPGFAYVPRTLEDEDFVIKIRPGVRITNIGNRIWRLPKEW